MTSLASRLTTLYVFAFVAMVARTQTHTRCCQPAQMTSKIYATRGQFDGAKNTASITETDGVMYLDYNKKMCTLDNVTSSTEGKKMTFKLIEDFNKNQTWYIAGNYCTKIPLTTPLRSPCVPKDAHLDSEFDLSGIQAQTWTFPKTNSSAMERITLAVKDCTPIQGTSVTLGETSQMTFFQFGDVTRGIKDPSVFDIPSFCTQ